MSKPVFIQFRSAAQQLLQRCEQLAQLSSMADGVARFYLTPEHKSANLLVQTWMQQAGMHSWEDAAANIWGRYRSGLENAPTVILGSHLDTVANAGKYDGILGVLAAIAVVEQLKAQGVQLPFHIDVAGFGDEEGVRFGTTLLGSCAAAGKWNSAWYSLKDPAGISLQEALNQYGVGELSMAHASRSTDNILAYLELHIEQGPVLEYKNLPVGIVTSIAGAKRLRFTLTGLAGHAGTVPMALRKDPLVAAALAMAEIETIAIRHQLVATVGSLNTYPGAVNVIPGACEFTLDIRSADDAKRDKALQQILHSIRNICAARNIELSIENIHSANAVACAPWLQKKMFDIISNLDYQPLGLMSGAGHDAMVFADMTDIGMLFLRCTGGISHNPLEAVVQQDVEVALGVFYSLILSLAEDTISKQAATDMNTTAS